MPEDKRKALRAVGRGVGSWLAEAQKNPEAFAKELEAKIAAADKPSDQPVYDPIDLVVDILTGGGTLVARIIGSVATGATMTGIDMAGGGTLAQMAGVVGGKAALSAGRTAVVKSQFVTELMKKIDELGGKPLMNEIGAIEFRKPSNIFRDLKANILRDIRAVKREYGEDALVGIRSYDPAYRDYKPGEEIDTSYNWYDGDIDLDSPIGGTAVFDTSIPGAIDEALGYSVGGPSQKIGVVVGRDYASHEMPEWGAAAFTEAKFHSIYDRPEFGYTTRAAKEKLKIK